MLTVMLHPKIKTLIAPEEKLAPPSLGTNNLILIEQQDNT